MKFHRVLPLLMASVTLLACSGAFGQGAIIGNPTTPGGQPLAQVPTQIINPNNGAPCIVGNTGCPGFSSSGGGSSATASAAALPVIAGTDKPQNIDLFSSTGVIVRDNLGNNIDWTAPVSTTPFTVVGASTPITTGASSANTGLPATATILVLTNPGSNDLFFKLGTSNAVTAASTDAPLQAGRAIAVAVGANTYVAAISPGGASSLTVLGGTGGNPAVTGGGGGSGSGGAVTNAGTFAVQNTAATPAGANNIGVTGYAQGSTTASQVGPLGQGAVTTSAPSYTTAQTSPLSLDTHGASRSLLMDTLGNPIDLAAAQAVTQSGTWTVQPGNTANTTAWKVDGSAVTQPVSGSLTNISGTISLPTGAATAAKQPALGTAGSPSADVITIQGSTADGAATAGNPILGSCAVLTTAPTTSSGNLNKFTCLPGALSFPRFAIGSSATKDVTTLTPGGIDGASQTLTIGLVTASVGAMYNGTNLSEARGIAATTDVGAGSGVQAVAVAPTSATGQAIAPAATTAVASSQILKASAGNGFRYAVTTGATAGFFMVFDATSAPADGAVTPLICRAIAANTSLEIDHVIVPDRFATGITAVFSSTGCYTKTASATAAFEGQVK